MSEEERGVRCKEGRRCGTGRDKKSRCNLRWERFLRRVRRGSTLYKWVVTCDVQLQKWTLKTPDRHIRDGELLEAPGPGIDSRQMNYLRIHKF